MFGGTKPKTGTKTLLQSGTTAAPAMRPSAPSILSDGLFVRGSIATAGEIQIDCRLEGNVSGAKVVVGANALIVGNVDAQELTVRGRIQGNIRAHRLVLSSSSHVEGDAVNAEFSVEAGAVFDGSIRHADNPLKEPRTKLDSEIPPTSEPMRPWASPAGVQGATPPVSTTKTLQQKDSDQANVLALQPAPQR